MSRTVYWDSCTFLGLINHEAEKTKLCVPIWEEAERGETVIVTSYLTFVEVYRAKCEGIERPLAEANDQLVTDFLRQRWIRPAVLDERIALAAKALMRAHPECKKPNDSIHLATALRLNVDEMHTFDGTDLLMLSTKVLRLDGVPLEICKPRESPKPPPPPQDQLELVT